MDGGYRKRERDRSAELYADTELPANVFLLAKTVLQGGTDNQLWDAQWRDKTAGRNPYLQVALRATEMLPKLQADVPYQPVTIRAFMLAIDDAARECLATTQPELVERVANELKEHVQTQLMPYLRATSPSASYMR